MSWHGSDEEHVALEAAAQGHDVVLTPEESLYFDHYQSDLPDEWPGQPPMTTLRQAYDTAVIPKGATAAEARRVIGVQGDLWTEFMPSFAHDQHALFPRIAALSELGWSAASEHDWNGFLQRLTAELARYRALGIGYADTAFAPAFDVTAVARGVLRVALSNQANFGEIRYTTDGSTPTSKSAQYVRPLEFSAQGKVTLRAATFEPGGFDLAAPRTQVLDASTLLSRDGSELASCSNQPAMRVDGNQPAQGPRPVYEVAIGDMCWLWRRAPLARHRTRHPDRRARRMALRRRRQGSRGTPQGQCGRRVRDPCRFLHGAIARQIAAGACGAGGRAKRTQRQQFPPRSRMTLVTCVFSQLVIRAMDSGWWRESHFRNRHHVQRQRRPSEMPSSRRPSKQRR